MLRFLFVCLLRWSSHQGNSANSHEGGYKHQTGNSQSLSYKHWFLLSVNDYELHKSRYCDSVTRRQYILRVIVKSAVSFVGYKPTTSWLQVRCDVSWTSRLEQQTVVWIGGPIVTLVSLSTTLKAFGPVCCVMRDKSPVHLAKREGVWLAAFCATAQVLFASFDSRFLN